MKTILSLSAFIIFISSVTFAQSTIPNEYRGSFSEIARGVLDGNNIETNFRNHGEMSRWGDIPQLGDGLTIQIDGIGYLMAARVTGERAKWSQYYGDGVSDTTLNPVIINYRDSGKKISPYTGELWGWLPLNGFHNPDRKDPVRNAQAPIPAISDDPTSWPAVWPDRLNQTDAGWQGSWNGFQGKGRVNGDQETFYVMDDHSDREYSFGVETEGPHSELGVYHPSASDSTMGGLGLQTEVRTIQFNDLIGNDMLFTHYRTTNISEKNLSETWAAFLVDFGLNFDPDDSYFEYNNSKDYMLLYGGSNTNAGVAFILLEHSIHESGAFKFDNDNDGIKDESKFNEPGQYLEGKAAIDDFLNNNYNMNRFNEVYIDLEDFPAYRNERWWTGDEDMDWIAYDDFNQNGMQDGDEPIEHDLGRDGLGPAHENYPGPDEGENDGIPTQGEPNFGERDMLEAENRGISLLDINTRPFYESGKNLRDDTWLFDRMMFASENIGNYENGPVTIDYEPFMMFGVGPFELKQNESSTIIMAVVFADDSTELYKKIEQAIAIYESDYGQTGFLTPTEKELELPTQVSLSQNYPNPFNPSTTIQFSLNKSKNVTLSVFDVTGRLVSEVISRQQYSAGIHQISFDGSSLSSGLYLYRLEVGQQVITKKLTLIK